MSLKKLDDLDEIALRHFMDDRGKAILASIMSPIVDNQRKSVLCYNVTEDPTTERRLVIEKHKLTGAELLQREFFVQLQKYCKQEGPAKK